MSISRRDLLRFTSLVRREVHTQVKSVKFLALTATAAILALLAVRVGAADFSTRLQNAEQLLQQQSVDQLRGGGKLTGIATEPGLRAVRLPNPLSIVVRGIDEQLPQFWDFSPARVRQGPADIVQQPVADASMTLDFEFLVRVVFGLLALLVGLDALIADRETGTLRALLSQPISGSTILASKLLGGMVALTFALAILVGGVIAGETWWAPAAYASRLASFVAVGSVASLLYLFALLSAGLLVGSLVRSNRAAHSISVIVWVYVTLVIPGLVPLIGRSLARVSPQAVEATLDSTYERQIRDLQERLGDLIVASAPPGTNFRGMGLPDRDTIGRIDVRWKQQMHALRQTLSQIDRDAVTAARRQRQTVKLLSLASPGTEIQDSLEILAGTSRLVQARWDDRVREYQAALTERLFDDRPRLNPLVPEGGGQVIFKIDRKELPSIASMPIFQAPNVSLRGRVADALPNLVALGVYATVLLTAAFVAFQRMPV